MKKIIIFLLMALSISAQAQRSITTIRVPNDSAAFGRGLVRGDQVIDTATGVSYILRVGLDDTSTIRHNLTRLKVLQESYISSGFVPSSRALSINGVSYALTSNRSWSLGLQNITNTGNTTTLGIAVASLSAANLSSGYVPYYTTKLVNGPIYANSSSIGIGTQSLSEKVNINGAIKLANGAPTNNYVGGYALWNNNGTLYWNGYPLSNGVGAAITGSGSDGRITKWTGPTSIGQSIIIDSINKIHVSGGVNASGTGNFLGGLGVGTYSPTEAADIHGGIHLASATPNNSAAGGNVLWNNGGTLYWNGVTLSTGTASALTGSGTANTLAKWTTTGSIGNSLITDDGTSVSISGNTSAPSFTSTTTSGAPFTVNSNYLVHNLNAEYLNGHPSSDFVTSAVPYSLATSNVDLNGKDLGNVGRLAVGSDTLPTTGVGYFKGKVGFNVKTPSEMIDVGGGIHLRSATPNDASTGGYTLWNNGGILYWNGVVLSTGSASSLSGSGPANSIAKWATGSSLGESIMTDDGSTVTINGDLLATGKIGINVGTASQALDVGGKIALNGTTVAYAPTAYTGTLILGSGGGSLYHSTGYQGYYNTFAGLGSGTSIYSGYENTGVGYQSLNYVSSGYGNTATGTQALFYTSTGYYNTATGIQALYNNLNGNYNQAGGAYSLFANHSGSNNTAEGYYSLYSNYYGSNNTAEGYYSLYSNYSGVANTALGAEALFSINTPDSNTAVGYQAGRYVGSGTIANTTGRNSLFLGANSRPAADGDNNEIVIGTNNVGNGSNTATLGDSTIQKTTLYGAVGFGVKAPLEKADIRGAIRLADTLPQDAAAGGYALWNQGGVLYWNGSALATGGGGTSGIAGSGNPGVLPKFITSDSLGESPIAVADTTINIAGPVNIRNKPAIYVYPNVVGSLTVGGPVSSTLDNSWATYNTFIGYLSGGSITTGSTNIAVGGKALRNVTSGSGNVAVGGVALGAATGGSYNVALGYYSLYTLAYGTNNIGIGNRAIYSTTNGGHNIGIGNQSLYSISTGSYNIGIGYDAGHYYNPSGSFSLTLPQNCIYIGNNTRSFANSQTAEIVIGNNALGHGSHTITLGDTTNVGIYLYGSVSKAKIDTLIIHRGAPTSSIGVAGDSTGMVAVNDTAIFYCTAPYDGTTNIWKYTKLSSNTW